MVKKQVKSKERVSEHGEVYTAEREVNNMLDLVKSESERIDSRFLEPACGDGNFLSVILQRKLDTVRKKYRRNLADYEKYAILALSSLYGVDILEDNISECRDRLGKIWLKNYKSCARKNADPILSKCIAYILSHNILCGNALTMLTNDNRPIIFSQWDFTSGFNIKRKDYRLDELVSGGNNNEQMRMFEDENNLMATKWEYDKELDTLMPSPIREYPPMDYLTIAEVEE